MKNIIRAQAGTNTLNIEHILNEVERERRKVLVSKLYKEGMYSTDEIIIIGTAEALGNLPAINPDLFVELYEKGLSCQNKEIRWAVVNSLGGLARVDSDRFVDLYKKISTDRDYRIPSISFSALNQLASVDFERFRDLKGELHVFDEYLAGNLGLWVDNCFDEVIEAYKTGLNNINDFVRYGTVSALDFLANVAKDTFVELFKQGLTDKTEKVRHVTASKLSCLASVDPDRFVELYEQGLQHKDKEVRRRIVRTLNSLVDVDPDRFVELYEQGLQHKDKTIRITIRTMLEGLVKLRPDQAVTIYEQLWATKNYDIKEYIANQLAALSVLANDMPDRFVQLCEEAFNDPHWPIRKGAADALGYLASINTDKFVELYEKGINDENGDVRCATAVALHNLASVNFERFMELYEKGIHHQNDFVCSKTVESLTYLLSIRPDDAIKLFEQGLHNEIVSNAIVSHVGCLADVKPDIFLKLYGDVLLDLERFTYLCALDAVSSLGALAATVTKDLLVPIKDAQYSFIESYLNSKYVKTDDGKLKSEDEVLRELTDLVHGPCQNWGQVIQVLEQGCAEDLSDIIESAKLDSPYQSLCYLGGGASGKVFLVYSREMGKNRALKIIDPAEVNEEEAKILALFEDNPSKYFPRIFDAGEHIASFDNKRMYSIVMEYVQGQPLDKKVDEEDVLFCGAQILDAICHLRKLGIVHRDLRPENILLTEEEQIKVLDFGIATSQTNTPLSNNRRYGGPTDLFSLGLIMYKMSTGEHLILSRDKEMHTDTYANRIAELKTGMILENGMLCDAYKRKIEQNIPNEIQQIILDCLLSTADNETEIISLLKRNFSKSMPFKFDPHSITQMLTERGLIS